MLSATGIPWSFQGILLVIPYTCGVRHRGLNGYQMAILSQEDAGEKPQLDPEWSQLDSLRFRASLEPKCEMGGGGRTSGSLKDYMRATQGFSSPHTAPT